MSCQKNPNLQIASNNCFCGSNFIFLPRIPWTSFFVKLCTSVMFVTIFQNHLMFLLFSQFYCSSGCMCAMFEKSTSLLFFIQSPIYLLLGLQFLNRLLNRWICKDSCGFFLFGVSLFILVLLHHSFFIFVLSVIFSFTCLIAVARPHVEDNYSYVHERRTHSG